MASSRRGAKPSKQYGDGSARSVPFAGNAQAAAIQFPEQESINTCDSTRFQNLEALAAKRMERMADLRPS